MKNISFPTKFENIEIEKNKQATPCLDNINGAKKQVCM